MQFLKYFKYLSLLSELMSFVKEAEQNFPSAGSGRDKLQYVTTKFRALVASAAATGLINAKLAKALNDGSEQLVTIIVQILNAVDVLRTSPSQP